MLAVLSTLKLSKIDIGPSKTLEREAFYFRATKQVGNGPRNKGKTRPKQVKGPLVLEVTGTGWPGIRIRIGHLRKRGRLRKITELVTTYWWVNSWVQFYRLL